MEEYLDHQENVDWLEAFECEHDHTLRADQPIVVCLDGVGFRHVTRYLQKPYDEKFHNAMIETSRRLAHHFGLNFIMTASDEITIVRYNKDERFSIWCGQSRDRILSSVSSLASTILADACRSCDIQLAWHPSFAGHVCNAPTEESAAQLVLGIERRHHKRSISNMVHYYLGKQDDVASISELKRRLSSAGYSWESMPHKFKHGTAFRREMSSGDEMKFRLKVVQRPLFYRQDLVSDIFRKTSGD